MKTFLNFRNNLTMLYKNLPEAELAHVMRVRRVLDYVAAFKSLLLDRNLGEFKAVVNGRKAFKAWRKDFDADRRQIQALRTSATEAMRKPYSILWQYYVHGCCTYRNIKE